MGGWQVKYHENGNWVNCSLTEYNMAKAYGLPVRII